MKIAHINFNQNTYSNYSINTNNSDVAFGMDPGPCFPDTHARLLVHFYFKKKAANFFEELNKLNNRKDGAIWDLMQIIGEPNKFFAVLLNKGQMLLIGKTFNSPEHLLDEKDGLIKFLKDNCIYKREVH